MPEKVSVFPKQVFVNQKQGAMPPPPPPPVLAADDEMDITPPPAKTVDPATFNDADWLGIMWYLHTNDKYIRCSCGCSRRLMRDPCWNCGY